MKKLVTIVFITATLMILLVIFSFFIIDLAGHRGFQYDVSVDGRSYGSVRVDRYVTEDKVVYKSSAEYPYSSGYPSVSEKLYLKKRTMTPLKFTREVTGARSWKSLTRLTQDGEVADFLFLEHPRFIRLKDFETGKKTMVFSPDDIMLYMPIMEKYNYWKKGAQFFEVMVPVDGPLPPMRDKIGVRFFRDEYIPVMGRRVEAESFAVTAEGLPEARIFLSKHKRTVLALEIAKRKMKFILVSSRESPGKRVGPILKKLNKMISALSGDKAEKAAPAKEEDLVAEDSYPGKEVFFESGNLMLSGRLWIPDKEAPLPAALVIPRDGPRTTGEQRLLDSLGEFLSSEGVIVLVYDSPGQGKSQGSLTGLGDEKRARNIRAAVRYLQEHPEVKKGAVNLIGHEGGGYLALKAAEALPDVRTCILLSVSLGIPKLDSSEVISKESLRAFLSDRSLGPFDEGFMKYAAAESRKSLGSIRRSTEDFSFFLGTRVPLKEYRELMSRSPYEAIISFNRPLLLIFGRTDKDFDLQAVEKLKRRLREKDRRNRIAVLSGLGAYMGEMVEDGGSWGFSANNEVLDLIGNWIRENGTYEEEVEAQTQSAGSAGIGPDAV